MAVITTSLTNTASADAGSAAINGSYSLGGALTWGAAAYDYGNCCSASSYSLFSSAYLAGRVTSGDLFAADGSFTANRVVLTLGATSGQEDRDGATSTSRAPATVSSSTS